MVELTAEHKKAILIVNDLMATVARKNNIALAYNHLGILYSLHDIDSSKSMNTGDFIKDLQISLITLLHIPGVMDILEDKYNKK